MLSYQAMAVLHCGHRDPGRTMDSRPGRRWMQTFKKLPMKAPTSTATVTCHCGLILPPPRASRTRPSARPLYVNPLKGTRPRTRPAAFCYLQHLLGYVILMVLLVGRMIRHL